MGDVLEFHHPIFGFAAPLLSSGLFLILRGWGSWQIRRGGDLYFDLRISSFIIIFMEKGTKWWRGYSEGAIIFLDLKKSAKDSFFTQISKGCVFFLFSTYWLKKFYQFFSNPEVRLKIPLPRYFESPLEISDLESIKGFLPILVRKNGPNARKLQKKIRFVSKNFGR